MMNELTRSCAIVVGVGVRAGIGGALCARFAKAGMPVYAVGRDAEKLRTLIDEIAKDGGNATAVTLDASRPEEIASLFDRIASDGCHPELVVFNASERNVPKAFLDMTPEFVENLWRVCCFGGLLVGQEAVRRMLPRQQGTILFTGATASIRGRAEFGGFASAKAGLRSIAQAMAREFGPKGIHVAHIIVDGMVDGARVGEFGNGIGKSILLSKGTDGTLDPDAVAESYWQLHLQPRSVWTHELDLRPFCEPF
ncbi:MAG: SDR family NAD(P)-dependent oxidoreductase [Pseudomonadota bacterium]